jgi:hypothetical protein
MTIQGTFSSESSLIRFSGTFPTRFNASEHSESDIFQPHRTPDRPAGTAGKTPHSRGKFPHSRLRGWWLAEGFSRAEQTDTPIRRLANRFGISGHCGWLRPSRPRCTTR